MSGDSWETPPELYNPLNEEFKFGFDLCADENNKKCGHWSSDIEKTTKEILDCKNHLFSGYNLVDTYWINPPYSKGNIDLCMADVSQLNDIGKVIVSLTRFDPTAKWFKDNVDGVACEVRMLDKRVKFINEAGNSSGSYPFPCCVSIFRGYRPRATQYYSWGWK